MSQEKDNSKELTIGEILEQEKPKFDSDWDAIEYTTNIRYDPFAWTYTEWIVT